MSDLISREAAISTAQTMYERCDTGDLIDYREMMVESLKVLPAAQPERKPGKWICSDDMYETAVCSCCGWDTTEPWIHIKTWYKFCPNCGADMRGVQMGGRMNDDLISRVAAIDQLHQSYNLLDAEQRLADLSSAQPEIIRCRDCVWHDVNVCRNQNSIPWMDDDFCSMAERREVRK